MKHLISATTALCIVSWGDGMTRAASAFSEPDLTVYGKVFNTAAGPGVLAGGGEVVWTFTAEDSSVTTVTTQIAPIGTSEFNYRLEVPVEIVLAGFEVEDDAIEATSSDAAYTLSATVNGTAASLIQADATPYTGPLSFSEIRRGTFARIDLQFAGEIIDSDFDSIPDFWEQRYAPITDANNPNDVFDDVDGDGVPNIAEFMNGTAPDCYEWSRWLTRNNLPEGDLTLSATDADPDADQICNAMEYALGGDPRTPDREAVWSQAQVSVAEDPDTGESYLTMTIQRPAHRQCAVEYVVETTTDLTTWNRTEGVDIQTLLSETTQVRVRDAKYMGEAGAERRFMRLRLVMQ